LLLLLFGSFPGSHKVVVFPLVVIADLKNNRAEQAAGPPDRTKLARVIALLVEYVDLIKDLLRFIEANPMLLFDVVVFLATEVKA
jgi:hypothetical protein